MLWNTAVFVSVVSNKPDKTGNLLLRHLHNDGQPGIGLGWGVQPIGDWGVFSVHSGSASTFLCLAAVSHNLDRDVAFVVNGGSEDDETFEPAVVSGFKQMIANCA